jgi:pantoate--beta-alanine ligase
MALVRWVVADLSLPADIIGCATVRDPDGLALSSRNARLSPHQRVAALALPRALKAGAAVIAAGEDRSEAVEQVMADVVAAEPGAVIDYAAVVRGDDLEPAGTPIGDGPIRLIIAATVGPVRLIDNLDPRRSR